MLERLKFWLLIALLVSNLAVGLLALRFLGKASESYGAIIDRSVPVLNNLRTLTRELSTVQRLARRVVDPATERSWPELVAQLDELSNRARQHTAEIGVMDGLRLSTHAEMLEKQGRLYDQQVDEFLQLLHAKRLDEAAAFNASNLRPTYERFMEVLDGAAEHVQQQGMYQRERYEQDSRLFSRFLLAFAGWPLIAAGMGVAAMFILMLALLVSVFAPGLRWTKPPGGSGG